MIPAHPIGEPISLEDFARILAVLAWLEAPPEEVFDRLGVDAHAFSSASKDWNARLVRGSRAGKLDELTAFTAAFSATSNACRDRGLVIGDLGGRHNDVTARMPPSEEIQRLIREAQPHFAFARAAPDATTKRGPPVERTPEDAPREVPVEETTLHPIAVTSAVPVLPFVAPPERKR